MSLEQAIVIRSEYTRNLDGKGSRGSTLNKYATTYMTRSDATEVLITTPVRDDGGVLRYSSRYINRASATEQLYTPGVASNAAIEYAFNQQDRLNWRTFSDDSLSLRHEELLEKSHLIQKCFEKGLTVIKPIISFTSEYLKETGVLPDDFEMAGPGSFRGKVDQLKLRKAVTAGFQNLARIGGFVKPLWLASIQLDTSHVHVHGLMVDQENGTFRKTKDGSSRGKINKKEKQAMRRGIHHSLLALKPLKSYRKALDNERQNVVSFTKEQAYRTIGTNSQVQSLLSLLPKDSKKWRYGSNSPVMRRCDALSQKIVYGLWANHGDESGFTRMQDRLVRYADEKLRRDNTSGLTFESIYQTGMELLMKRSVNGLYRSLKEIAPETLTVVTPPLVASALDDSELVRNAVSQTDDLLMYHYRARKYDKRKNKRSKTVLDVSNAIDLFDETAITKGVHPDAMSMRLYYEYDLAYNMKLVDKYRYFFRYDDKEEQAKLPVYLAEQDKLLKVYERLEPSFRFVKNMADRSIYKEIGLDEKESQQSPQRFASRVLDVYGLVQADRFLTPMVYERFADETLDKVSDYCESLRKYAIDGFRDGVLGSDDWLQSLVVTQMSDLDSVRLEDILLTRNMSFVAPPTPRRSMDRLDKSAFDAVKYLDIHEVLTDKDAPHIVIDRKWSDAFHEDAKERLKYKELSKRYVDGTKQQATLVRTWFDDVDQMVAVDADLQKGAIEQYYNHKEVDELSATLERNIASVRLDAPMMRNIFQQSLDTISFEELVDEMDSLSYNEL